MPTAFYDRERAFEAKFARDEELRFLVLARRDKLFARWAADRMALSSQQADELVKEVVSIPDGPGHEQALLRHVSDRLSAHGESFTSDLQAILDRCMQDSARHLTDMPPGRSQVL